METSLINYNLTNYQLLNENTLPSWIRVNIANRIAYNGEEWGYTFEINHSGTHNSQWLIVDYNRYRQGKKDGLVWMVEEAFTSYASQDVTQDLLLKNGYVSSYNIAYNKQIYDMLCDFNATYDNDTRAGLYRQHQYMATNLEAIKHLTYLNQNLTGSQCKEIAARCDIPSPGSKLTIFGLIDTKITSSRLQADKVVAIKSSPTTDGVKPFDWRDWPQMSHVGMPDVWDFPWITLNYSRSVLEQSKDWV